MFGNCKSGFILLHLFQLINGQTADDVKNLYNDIFDGYRSEIVPAANHSQPIEIGIAFYLMAINSFQVVDETLSVNGGLILNWTDVSIAWNPQKYGNKSSLEIPSTDIWLPWIYLINSAKTLEPIGSDSFFRATIFSNGNVVYSPGDVLDVKCATDVASFPFDTQNCELEFHVQHVWGSGNESYIFTTVSDAILMDYYTENSNWEIIYTCSYTKLHSAGFYSYQVKISLQRKPRYHAVMIILPTMLLCFLNPVVFLLPVESGERISLAMTILLSYAIFLTLVAESIPASSNPMCFLLIIMILITMISGLTVIFVIISNRYYYKKSYEPGKIASCLAHIIVRGKTKSITPGKLVKEGMCFPCAKDVSEALDKIFLVTSYTMICVVLATYLLFVFI